MLADRH